MKLTIHDCSRTETADIRGAFEFAERVHQLGLNVPDGGTSALWFRGHAKVGWKLKPSIGRRFEDGGLCNAPKGRAAFEKEERALLQRFKRYSYPFVQRLLTDWEAITLGQHHQLPTRLLDWTSNPLVALFFAVETERNADGAVFAYRPRNDAYHQISMFDGQTRRKRKAADPLTVNGIKTVYPMLLADRLITQSGGFTVQDPRRCLMQRDDENFDQKDLDVLEIYKWRLPKGSKVGILDQLHRVGVNRQTLFPGLDGVGHGLRVQEELRRVPVRW